MSLERTTTRTIRPMLTPEASSALKTAKPFQRLVANLFDVGLLAFIVLNTYKHFDLATILPKSAMRHHYFIVILYYYFILTILPHYYFGQTIGQFITGIKVMTSNFKKPSLFQIIARDFMRPTTLFFPAPVLSKKSRAWYDTFLKTTVADVR